MFDGIYFNRSQIHTQKDRAIEEEMNKFADSLDRGLNELKKASPSQLNTRFAFNLFQTHGFPFEVAQELIEKKGGVVDKEEFKHIFESHKKLSRKAAKGMFKGGLADKSKETVKLHTATHLLHKALRQTLGDQVRQEGSNITAERLRFDFKHPQALTDQEKEKVENVINQKIKEDLPVHKTIEDRNKALKSGALAFFKETYPEKVSVYTIGEDPKKDWFSKELCGGPHVQSTGEIGKIQITKEKSIGAGIRRIYVELAE